MRETLYGPVQEQPKTKAQSLRVVRLTGANVDELRKLIAGASAALQRKMIEALDGKPAPPRRE